MYNLYKVRMNKLNDADQQSLDFLVKTIDHYKRSVLDFSLLECIARGQILQLLKGKVAYTSDNRRICFNGDIVKIDRRPRQKITIRMRLE